MVHIDNIPIVQMKKLRPRNGYATCSRLRLPDSGPQAPNNQNSGLVPSIYISELNWYLLDTKDYKPSYKTGNNV